MAFKMRMAPAADDEPLAEAKITGVEGSGASTMRTWSGDDGIEEFDESLASECPQNLTSPRLWIEHDRPPVWG